MEIPGFHCVGKQYEYRTNIQKKGYAPKVNGCGGEGGIHIPDNLMGFVFLESFTPACNKHDECYGTCGSDKSQCDIQFWKDMLTICSRLNTYNGNMNEESGFNICEKSAFLAYSFVTSIGGKYYEAGQDDACEWKPCT